MVQTARISQVFRLKFSIMSELTHIVNVGTAAVTEILCITAKFSDLIKKVCFGAGNTKPVVNR